LKAGLLSGEMTSVTIWPPAAKVQHPALVLPSSKVMNKTPFCCQAGDARILPTQIFSHVSPVLTEQSCILLHMFGVIHVYSGTVLFLRSVSSCVSGTILLQRAVFVRMLSK